MAVGLAHPDQGEPVSYETAVTGDREAAVLHARPHHPRVWCCYGYHYLTLPPIGSVAGPERFAFAGRDMTVREWWVASWKDTAAAMRDCPRCGKQTLQKPNGIAREATR